MKTPRYAAGIFSIGAAALLACSAETGGIAQVLVPRTGGDGAASDALSYADIADLFAVAPLVLRARIVAATPLKTAAVAPGKARFYVEADVVALIRGRSALAPRVAYVVDVATDSRGKLPKLKKTEVLLAAQPVPGRPGEIQLTATDAQLSWSAALEGRVRALVTALADPGAPPVVKGVSSAFHVAGTIAGESETQIFLATATGAPVSLTILRRPGQEPRAAVAFGEIVDDSAALPAADTLGWYRLACSLPRDLPVAATSELGRADAEAAREDYALALRGLAPCVRTRR